MMPHQMEYRHRCENMKYIVVSATADEKIYRQYFGAERVDFYECKQAKYDGRLLRFSSLSIFCARRTFAVSFRNFFSSETVIAS